MKICRISGTRWRARHPPSKPMAGGLNCLGSRVRQKVGKYSKSVSTVCNSEVYSMPD